MKRNANLLQSQHLLQSVSSQKGSHFWKVRIKFVPLHNGTVLIVNVCCLLALTKIQSNYYRTNIFMPIPLFISRQFAISVFYP